jgi:hypothetical protein
MERFQRKLGSSLAICVVLAQVWRNGAEKQIRSGQGPKHTLVGAPLSDTGVCEISAHRNLPIYRVWGHG